MSRSPRNKEVVKEAPVVVNDEFACPVCGRLSVDPKGCAEHKSEE